MHIHDTAVTPIEFVINDASYRPGLYVCAPVKDPIFFQFASSAPSDLADCKWELVATRRQQEGAAQFDAWLDVRSVCGPSIGRALLAVAALPLEQDLCHKADAAWLGGACLGPPDNPRLGRLGLGGDGHCHVL